MISDEDNYNLQGENEYFEVSVSSILGDRAAQEDRAAIAIKDDEGIIVVCDGMGGHKGGKLASRIAVESLLDQYTQAQPISDIPAFFMNSIDVLDEAITLLKNPSGDTLAAGTTLSSVIVRDKRLYWVSVGDSRIYLIRGDEIVQVTEDHNFKSKLDKQLAYQIISLSEYNRLMDKGEMLISYIGIGGVEVVDINKDAFALQADDRILITSDGLVKSLDDHAILTIVNNFTNIRDASTALTNKAIRLSQHGNLDNTTVSLIRIK